jgi:ABC-2 type transport system permease protein
MSGFSAILKKELADHFSSYRFLILFALIAMVSLITAYMVGLNVSHELEGVTRPKFIFLLLFTASGVGFSLVQFIAFFGPLIGLIMGFDTINRERNEGTLSKLLSQPIYRDAVINAKFMAGVFIIALILTAIILVISALGLMILGVVPGIEEIWRIFIYLVISIIYISLWLGVAILFSILFRSVSTSALAALAVWIFFTFFVSIGAGAVAGALVPYADQSRPQALMKRMAIQNAITLASPIELYNDATATIIDPMRRTTRRFLRLGTLERISMSRFSGPLPLGQSIILVWPYVVFLLALTAICFAISYTSFMRQEIRSL